MAAFGRHAADVRGAEQEKVDSLVDVIWSSAMDMNARQRLLDRLLPLYDQGLKRVSITPEEFFSGNSDEGSLGGGNPDYPLLEVCQRTLGAIQERPEVLAVFLEVNEVPEGENDLDMWITVIRAFVITSVSVQDVSQWLEPLKLRDIWDANMELENDLLREIDESEPLPYYETRIRLPYSLNKHEVVRVVWVDLRDLR